MYYQVPSSSKWVYDNTPSHHYTISEDTFYENVTISNVLVYKFHHFHVTQEII